MIFAVCAAGSIVIGTAIERPGKSRQWLRILGGTANPEYTVIQAHACEYRNGGFSLGFR